MGSAANLAMRRLAARCRAIESAARSSGLPDARALDQLACELDSARLAYAEILGS
jgi:HPt (histidine-containing phosphotransfer) domain-containing protein